MASSCLELMSGTGNMPRHPFDDGRRHRGGGGYQESPYTRGPVPRPPHPAMLEEELEAQQHEIRRLVSDNRRLAEDRIAFQRELAGAKEEMRRLSMVIRDIRDDKEAHSRELIEKGRKLEADLRAAEPLRNDAVHLRAEVQKLNAARQELAAQVQSVSQELARARADNQQIPVMRTEIDGLEQEVMRARAAFEYEKKGSAELIEQRQAMEKNLIGMAREAEKLRADLANADGRSWGLGGHYGMKLGSPDAAFPTSYGDGFGIHSGAAEKAPPYGAGSGSWGASDKFRLGRH